MPALEQVEKQKTAGYVNLTPQQAKRRAKIEEEEAKLKALQDQIYNRGVDNDSESQEDEDEAVEDTAVVQKKEVDTSTKDAEQDDKPLSAEEQTFKKRYGDLRRHLDEVKKELTQKNEELEARLKQTAGSMPAGKEELEAWIEKNPDAARIVEAIAAKKAEERFAAADQRLKDLDREREEVKRAKAESEIRKAHPDFDSLRSSDDFHNWAGEQSKWIQDTLYENQEDAKAVIRVIDLYKVDTGQTVSAKKEKAKALASSVDVRQDAAQVDTKEKPTFSESQIQRNSHKWFEQNEKQIMEAMREGRFKYDISGGAR